MFSKGFAKSGMEVCNEMADKAESEGNDQSAKNMRTIARMFESIYAETLRHDLCEACQGKGVIEGYDEQSGGNMCLLCRVCNGTGKKPAPQFTECPACFGAGFVDMVGSSKTTACGACKGKGCVEICD